MRPGPIDGEVGQPRAGGEPRRLGTGSQVQVDEAGEPLPRCGLAGRGGSGSRRSPAGGVGETLRVLTVQQTGDLGFVTEHVSSFQMPSKCRWWRYRS